MSDRVHGLSSVTVEPYGYDAPEETLRAVLAIRNSVEAEFLPDDPPDPYEEFERWMRSPRPFKAEYRWIARDARGEIVGDATFSHATTEDNRNLGGFNINVSKDHRRQGIATALLAPIIEIAEREGRTMLGSGCRQGSDGERFLEWLGGSERLVERRSRMRLDEVDRSMLEQWIEQAKERADGYELLQWQGSTPEEHIERFAEVLNVMNTAPRESYEMEDETNTPEMVRAMDERLERIGLQMYVSVVRHVESGEFAGFTTIGVSRHNRYIAWQWGTGTWPHHRNRGIGRWLKAANLFHMLEHEPESKVVDTWNAGSNATMLNINVAMGFRPLEMMGDWQVPLETLAATVAQRGRAATV